MKNDPYANESTADLDPDIFTLWLEAEDAARRWAKEAERLEGILQSQLGDAHAGLVRGRKLVTNRPQNKYRIAALLREYPELTEQYVKPVTKEEFDFDTFKRVHAEIAELFQSRSFRSVGHIE